MKQFTAKTLNKIVQRVSDELTGDWIIIGGTVLPLVGIDYRVTVDVDMIPFGESDNQSQLDLMTIASELGLPVEAINQAGAFFLQKIPNWKSKVVLVRQGKKGAIYRPNVELYFILKISRLSETDAQDCIEYYKWSKKNEGFDPATLLKIVKAEMQKDSFVEKKKRLEKLLKAIR